MKQTSVVLTPEQGKKLIARAIAALPDVEEAMEEGTVVVIAGTTNRYVAEALLEKIGEKAELPGFFRGLTVPRGVKAAAMDPLEDVVISKGKRIRGKTIFDVAPDMQAGDLIFKGANAVNLETGEAAVLIGNNKVGTSMPLLEAAYGRRVSVMIPAGVEKRVPAPIGMLAEQVRDPVTAGPRLLPLPGEVFTEIEAIETLYDLEAEILAAGGVMGAEGCVYFLVSGEDEDVDRFVKEAAAI